MPKIVSYRQKLIGLAKIYKVHKVFDQNLKHSTYDIEIILLKNKVPLPSKTRGYISHIVINEVYKPIYESIKKKISIVYNVSSYFQTTTEQIKKKVSNVFSVNKFFNFNFNKNKNYKLLTEELQKKLFFHTTFILYGKKFFKLIENYFKFIISNIVNFYKILFKAIVEGLNNLYNFEIKEKILKNIFSKTIYASLVVVLVFSGFYIKNIITDVDSIKLALDIKSNESDKKLKKKKILELKIT